MSVASVYGSSLSSSSLSSPDLQGQWESSYGYLIKVVNDQAIFPGGRTFQLGQTRNTVEMDGWRVSPSKSSPEVILWKKQGEPDLKWTFEVLGASEPRFS